MGLFPVKILSVAELNHYLRELFESDEILRDIWISGEISNYSTPASGHVYFTLKDETSALKCVIWKANAMRLRMNLQPGLAVELHGSIGIYERDGQYQLYVDAVRLSGEGALYQEFLRLKTKLETEGLFDENRKRPIPERPQTIGIVTSPTGAALQDILNTFKTRFPMVSVIIAPAAVKGEEAPGEIVAALNKLNRTVQPDVIILARGGGSLEDLWAFNDERVVRAVAASSAPVITGVGHETDFTLADFAADWRAPTPTGAAVKATPDIADIKYFLAGLTERMFALADQSLADLRFTLNNLEGRLSRISPFRQIQNERQSLDWASAKLNQAISRQMQLERRSIESLEKRLLSLNPAAILQRGFAVVSTQQGEIVRSTTQVKTGDSLSVRVSNGQFSATVEK